MYTPSTKEVLDLVSTICNNNFIIAGGYPRDLTLGRPFKDIDVFTNIDQYALERGCNKAGIRTRLLPTGKYGNFTKGLSVHEYKNPWGPSVQFMRVFKPKPKINSRLANNNFLFDKPSPIPQTNQIELFTFIKNTFDCGICKIVMRPDGTIFRFKEFEHDVETQTIHMTNIGETKGIVKRSINHLKRIHVKYPEYKLDLSAADEAMKRFMQDDLNKITLS